MHTYTCINIYINSHVTTYKIFHNFNLLNDDHNMVILNSVAATVAFEQTRYNVSENTIAQILLILSKPSSSNVTVEVYSSNITAFGKGYH